uniref:LITAF domain-containing protein n=1 Tax=Anopheles culicifacies TaxID=139723 RepID=A0A182MHB4_9DIPT
MSLIATCILCQARLPYESSNTWILVRHLIDNHPLEAMPVAPKNNTEHKTEQKCQKQSKPQPMEDCNEQQETMPSVRVSQSRPKTKSLHNTKTVYKTTVAQWKPARFRVKCNECGGRFYPTIRYATSRISNGFGAACVLSCWPFCFLPALFTTPTKHHLHCSNCNAYLGLYDVQRDCLQEAR